MSDSIVSGNAVDNYIFTQQATAGANVSGSAISNYIFTPQAAAGANVGGRSNVSYNVNRTCDGGASTSGAIVFGDVQNETASGGIKTSGATTQRYIFNPVLSGNSVITSGLVTPTLGFDRTIQPIFVGGAWNAQPPIRPIPQWKQKSSLDSPSTKAFVPAITVKNNHI